MRMLEGIGFHLFNIYKKKKKKIEKNFLWCRMRRQAERWGAELFQEDVEFIDVKNNPFTVKSSERKVIYCFAAYCSIMLK